ncbi:flagellar biosynthetic protein FliQ [Legionella norrlandica]|uniref:flagellar biosynthetic protein FliQ n=1 Tax=Legionella norrlandica TaxID=1498499 RepID=UPI00055B3ECE|nr:flagellar biosynthetic protein FliQ [Legionella norrlandica]
MEYYTLIDPFKQLLWIVMVVVALITLPALLIGISISIFQAATQINDMSLTFIPKLLVMILVLIFSLPWLLSKLVSMTQDLMFHLPQYLS